MKFIISLSLCLISHIASAGWVDLNTGINDYLTGVIFIGNNGMVSGHKGLYYTTTGGNGASSWTKFNITGNSNDSLIYNHTKFNYLYSNPVSPTNIYLACGKDTVNDRAVLMLVSVPSLTYSLLYLGPSNSSLNRISWCSWNGSYYVVGDNGLILNYNSTSGTQIVACPLTDNFTSISFGANFYNIGANGKLIYGTYSGASLTFSTISTPTYHYKDVQFTGSGTNQGYGVGNSYFSWNNTIVTEKPNFDFGPLNANCCFGYFVGTDHGIFKIIPNYDCLEYQPSSANYNINSISLDPSMGSNMYACGTNGTVLKTTDSGGGTKPFAKLTTLDGCVNTNHPLNGITGSSNDCMWLVNNTIANFGCSTSFNTYYFSAAGQYTLSLIASNASGLSDTAVQIITIYPMPQKNLAYTVDKNIICKQSPLTISLPSPEQNVFYSLYKFGNSTNYGNSPVAVNTPLTFTSSAITTSGNYYLKATNSMAQCISNFTDTIKITVEHTKADFHCASINAISGDSIKYYQRCTDSYNFQWDFGSGASNPQSFLSNSGVTYSSTGAKITKLKVWTNNNCYDSITKISPTIYSPPSPLDSCWSVVNDNWMSSGIGPISHLSDSRTGFLICGSHDNDIFGSNYGTSYPSATKGGYGAKYDKYGALSWMVYTRNYPSMYDDIVQISEDKNANVYLCGTKRGVLFTNRGDSINKASTQSNYFITKFDSTGRTLMDLQFEGYSPTAFKVDKSGNIIIAGMHFATFKIYRNGISMGTYNSTSGAYFLILKISPSGNIVWNAGIDGNTQSGLNVVTIDTDKKNNIYISGSYDFGLKIYSAGSTTFSPLAVNGVSGIKSYLTKLDSNGIIKWKTNSLVSTVSSNNLAPAHMITDENGNCYVTGRNGIASNSDFQTFYNADGSTTQANIGEYYFLKVTTNGICSWINGNQYSYIGGGERLCRKGNEVSVIGWLSNNTSAPVSSLFTGQNNTAVSFSIYNGDSFIAVYDTLGNIKYVAKNGNNPAKANANYLKGVIHKPDNSYIIGQDISMFLGATNYNNFSTLLNISNGYQDGIMTKTFLKSCGIYTVASIATQLSAIDVNHEIDIFPNPATNKITLFSKTPLSIEAIKIIDATGKLVYNEIIHETVNEKKIYIESLTSGIYFLQVKTKDNLYNLKLIKN